MSLSSYRTSGRGNSGNTSSRSGRFMSVWSPVHSVDPLNHRDTQVELASVQEAVSNITIGKMRMQFWRDALKGIADVRLVPCLHTMYLTAGVGRVGLRGTQSRWPWDAHVRLLTYRLTTSNESSTLGSVG